VGRAFALYSQYAPQSQSGEVRALFALGSFQCQGARGGTRTRGGKTPS